MPALDLSYQDGLHRNRGLFSLPRAYGWIEFSNAVFNKWNAFQIKLATKKSDEETWTPIGHPIHGIEITDAIQRTLFCLAESAPDELGEGSHFVHVPFSSSNKEEGGSLDFPRSGNEIRVTLDDDVDAFSSDNASGILQFAVTTAMAGSE